VINTGKQNVRRIVEDIRRRLTAENDRH